MTGSSYTGSGFLNDMNEAIRQNPLSAVLIGGGLVWLFSRSMARANERISRYGGARDIRRAADGALDSTRSSLKSGVDSVTEGVSSAGDALKNTASDAADHLTRVASNYMRSTSKVARTIPETGSEMLDAARSNLTELFEKQPLALGALGMVIGASLAAALPASDIETTYLGEASDSFKEKAGQMATEQADRAAMVAKRAASAAAEEASRQAAAVDGAK